MEDIEYLEEYEDLILPTIKSNSRQVDFTGSVGGRRGSNIRQSNNNATARKAASTANAKVSRSSSSNISKPNNNNNKKSNIMDDEDSSSIDQDIFESLFYDQSDDEDNILQKKADPKLSQRRGDERASLDSLDLLVKDLGMQVGEKNVQKKSNTTAAHTPSTSKAATTQQQQQQKKRVNTTSTPSAQNAAGRAKGRVPQRLSMPSKPVSAPQKRPNIASTSTAAAQSSSLHNTSGLKSKPPNSFMRQMPTEKSKSIATVRPTVQQKPAQLPIKRFSNNNSNLNRNLAAAASSSRGSPAGLVTLSARQKMSSPVVPKRPVLPVHRPPTTIVKPEKREVKDPAEDPLSLEDITEALLDSDSDSFSISDISDETMDLLTDVEEDEDHIIDISNDSSIDDRNKDLESARAATPSPTVSDDDKDGDESTSPLHMRRQVHKFNKAVEQSLEDLLRDEENKHNNDAEEDDVVAIDKSHQNVNMLLERIDAALGDDKNAHVDGKNNDDNNKTNEEVVADLERELMPFLKKKSLTDDENEADAKAPTASTNTNLNDLDDEIDLGFEALDDDDVEIIEGTKDEESLKMNKDNTAPTEESLLEERLLEESLLEENVLEESVLEENVLEDSVLEESVLEEASLLEEHVLEESNVLQDVSQNEKNDIQCQQNIGSTIEAAYNENTHTEGGDVQEFHDQTLDEVAMEVEVETNQDTENSTAYNLNANSEIVETNVNEPKNKKEQAQSLVAIEVEESDLLSADESVVVKEKPKVTAAESTTHAVDTETKSSKAKRIVRKRGADSSSSTDSSKKTFKEPLEPRIDIKSKEETATDSSLRKRILRSPATVVEKQNDDSTIPPTKKLKIDTKRKSRRFRNLDDSEGESDRESAVENLQGSVVSTLNLNNVSRQEEDETKTDSNTKKELEAKGEAEATKRSEANKEAVAKKAKTEVEIGTEHRKKSDDKKKSEEKKSEEKKSEEKKSQEKKSEEKKSEEKKSEEKKSEVKKSEEKKSEVKKSEVKKSEEKKSEEKKSEVKKSEEKKSEEKKSEVKKSEEKKSEVKKSEEKKSEDKKSEVKQSEIKKSEEKKSEVKKSRRELESQKKSDKKKESNDKKEIRELHTKVHETKKVHEAKKDSETEKESEAEKKTDIINISDDKEIPEAEMDIETKKTPEILKESDSKKLADAKKETENKKGTDVKKHHHTKKVTEAKKESEAKKNSEAKKGDEVKAEPEIKKAFEAKDDKNKSTAIKKSVDVKISADAKKVQETKTIPEDKKAEAKNVHKGKMIQEDKKTDAKKIQEANQVPEDEKSEVKKVQEAKKVLEAKKLPEVKKVTIPNKETEAKMEQKAEATDVSEAKTETVTLKDARTKEHDAKKKPETKKETVVSEDKNISISKKWQEVKAATEVKKNTDSEKEHAVKSESEAKQKLQHTTKKETEMRKDKREVKVDNVSEVKTKVEPTKKLDAKKETQRESVDKKEPEVTKKSVDRKEPDDTKKSVDKKEIEATKKSVDKKEPEATKKHVAKKEPDATKVSDFKKEPVEATKKPEEATKKSEAKKEDIAKINVEAKNETGAKKETDAKKESAAKNVSVANRDNKAKEKLETKEEAAHVKKPIQAIKKPETIVIIDLDDEETETNRESEAKMESETIKKSVAKKEPEATKKPVAEKEPEAKKSTETEKKPEANRETEATKESPTKKEPEITKKTVAETDAESKKEIEEKKNIESKEETLAKKEPASKAEVKDIGNTVATDQQPSTSTPIKSHTLDTKEITEDGKIIIKLQHPQRRMKIKLNRISKTIPSKGDTTDTESIDGNNSAIDRNVVDEIKSKEEGKSEKESKPIKQDKKSTEEDKKSTEEDKKSTEEDKKSTEEHKKSTEEVKSTEEDKKSTEEHKISTEEVKKKSTEENKKSTEDDKKSLEVNKKSEKDGQSTIDVKQTKETEVNTINTDQSETDVIEGVSNNVETKSDVVQPTDTKLKTTENQNKTADKASIEEKNSSEADSTSKNEIMTVQQSRRSVRVKHDDIKSSAKEEPTQKSNEPEVLASSDVVSNKRKSLRAKHAVDTTNVGTEQSNIPTHNLDATPDTKTETTDLQRPLSETVDVLKDAAKHVKTKAMSPSLSRNLQRSKTRSESSSVTEEQQSDKESTADQLVITRKSNRSTVLDKQNTETDKTSIVSSVCAAETEIKINEKTEKTVAICSTPSTRKSLRHKDEEDGAKSEVVVENITAPITRKSRADETQKSSTLIRGQSKEELQKKVSEASPNRSALTTRRSLKGQEPKQLTQNTSVTTRPTVQTPSKKGTRGGMSFKEWQESLKSKNESGVLETEKDASILNVCTENITSDSSEQKRVETSSKESVESLVKETVASVEKETVEMVAKETVESLKKESVKDSQETPSTESKPAESAAKPVVKSSQKKSIVSTVKTPVTAGKIKVASSKPISVVKSQENELVSSDKILSKDELITEETVATTEKPTTTTDTNLGKDTVKTTEASRELVEEIKEQPQVTPSTSRNEDVKTKTPSTPIALKTVAKATPLKTAKQPLTQKTASTTLTENKATKDSKQLRSSEDLTKTEDSANTNASLNTKDSKLSKVLPKTLESSKNVQKDLVSTKEIKKPYKSSEDLAKNTLPLTTNASKDIPLTSGALDDLLINESKTMDKRTLEKIIGKEISSPKPRDTKNVPKLAEHSKDLTDSIKLKHTKSTVALPNVTEVEVTEQQKNAAAKSKSLTDLTKSKITLESKATDAVKAMPKAPTSKTLELLKDVPKSAASKKMELSKDSSKTTKITNFFKAKDSSVTKSKETLLKTDVTSSDAIKSTEDLTKPTTSAKSLPVSTTLPKDSLQTDDNSQTIALPITLSESLEALPKHEQKDKVDVEEQATNKKEINSGPTMKETVKPEDNKPAPKYDYRRKRKPATKLNTTDTNVEESLQNSAILDINEESMSSTTYKLSEVIETDLSSVSLMQEPFVDDLPTTSSLKTLEKPVANTAQQLETKTSEKVVKTTTKTSEKVKAPVTEEKMETKQKTETKTSEKTESKTLENAEINLVDSPTTRNTANDTKKTFENAVTQKTQERTEAADKTELKSSVVPATKTLETTETKQVPEVIEVKKPAATKSSSSNKRKKRSANANAAEDVDKSSIVQISPKSYKTEQNRSRKLKSELESLIEALPEQLKGIPMIKRRRRDPNASDDGNKSASVTTPTNETPTMEPIVVNTRRALTFKTPTAPVKVLNMIPTVVANPFADYTMSGNKTLVMDMTTATPAVETKTSDTATAVVENKIDVNVVNATRSGITRRYEPPQPRTSSFGRKTHGAVAVAQSTQRSKCRKLRVRVNRSIIKQYYRALESMRRSNAAKATRESQANPPTTLIAAKSLSQLMGGSNAATKTTVTTAATSILAASISKPVPQSLIVAPNVTLPPLSPTSMNSDTISATSEQCNISTLPELVPFATGATVVVANEIAPPISLSSSLSSSCTATSARTTRTSAQTTVSPQKRNGVSLQQCAVAVAVASIQADQAVASTTQGVTSSPTSESPSPLLLTPIKEDSQSGATSTRQKQQQAREVRLTRLQQQQMMQPQKRSARLQKQQNTTKQQLAITDATVAVPPTTTPPTARATRQQQHEQQPQQQQKHQQKIEQIQIPKQQQQVQNLPQQQQQQQQPPSTLAPLEPKLELEDEQLTAATLPMHIDNNGQPLLLNAQNLMAGCLPAAIVDNSGTRLYSFLHPAKYNRSHGAVMLDYCCPNLEGPMPAIDPTRDHAHVQSLVRELPAYIVMTTKVVTRADLEAKNNSIPASIRRKMEKLTSVAASSATVIAVNNKIRADANVAPNATPNAATNISANISTNMASNVAANAAANVSATPTLAAALGAPFTTTISALQKQLPATTTLTPKLTPADSAQQLSQQHQPQSKLPTLQQISAPVAGGATANASVPPRADVVRSAILRSNLRRFDCLLKKHSPRICVLSAAERQRIVEALLEQMTELTAKDVDMATRLLDEYCKYVSSMPPIRKNINSSAANSAAASSVPSVASTIETAPPAIPPATSVAVTTAVAAPITTTPVVTAAFAFSSNLAANASTSSGAATASSSSVSAAQKLEQLHASAVEKMKLSAAATPTKRQVPIYDKDRNIIGYQMHAIERNARAALITSYSKAPTTPINAATLNTKRGITVTPTTSTLKQPAQESPRIFYTKPLQTSTPIATPAGTSAANIAGNSSSSNIGNNSSTDASIRLGRSVTIKHINQNALTRTINVTGRLSTLPPVLAGGTPTTTPHSFNTRTTTMAITPTSLGGSATTVPIMTTKRVTRTTAGQLVVVTKGKDGRNLNHDDESILPDNGRNAEIKQEQHDDELISGS